MHRASDSTQVLSHIAMGSSQADVLLPYQQAYHGGLQHVRKPEDRRAAVGQVTERAAAAVAAIEQAGLRVQVVTGGGSGSYKIEAGSGVYNEVQPGEMHCCWLIISLC